MGGGGQGLFVGTWADRPGKRVNTDLSIFQRLCGAEDQELHAGYEILTG